jgi:hypothetical protein
VKNKYVILRHLGDMCLFTSALRASVNKSHIPSLPQNNLYIITFEPKVVHFSACNTKIAQNLLITQGYIFRILPTTFHDQTLQFN